jgi:membrane protease YdiL (CAAX protease family)
LPQLFLIFTNAARGWVALVIAVLVSSTLYAASHIPALLLDPYNELGLIKPLWLIVALGIMLAIAFIVTRNLFICIGMHSLWNARALVIEASDERARAAWWIASSLLVLVWLVASTGVISIRARKNVMQ